MTRATLLRQIRVGDRIIDNDPREPNRILTVREIGPERVVAARGPAGRRQETRIALKRIHTDDKPRRSGWSLIKENGDAP